MQLFVEFERDPWPPASGLLRWFGARRARKVMQLLPRERRRLAREPREFVEEKAGADQLHRLGKFASRLSDIEQEFGTLVSLCSYFHAFHMQSRFDPGTPKDFS